VKATKVAWPGETDGLDPVELIRSKKVDFVLNVPKNLQRDELTRGSQMRMVATRFGCAIVTNMEKMVAYAQAMTFHPDFAKVHTPRELPQYR
jgi:carbamoyl-phosphate synthase large subunit